MTTPAVRPARGRSLPAPVRLGGALLAAIALAALVAISPPGSARAASSSDSYNQMTGIGETASGITVNWTQGLLNAQNQRITAAGSELAPNSDRSSGTGPLSFMYNDFKNLQVTVSQTQNIGHQGITVTWKGGLPTNKTESPQTNFLQMMECYGDSSTGPSPEDCEYGSQGMLAAGANNPAIGNRTGFLCPAGSSPDPSNPPVGLSGDPAWGCDPYEPTTENPSHCNPAGVSGDRCEDGVIEIPFVPVDDPTHPIYGQQNLPTDFSEFNTNEVQEADTSTNDTGQQQFETLTSVQAPHLGCGALESNGQPRGCWLVIVPRGTFEPNGYAPRGFAAPAGYLETSPLSAANWAQRIQIHLAYAPLGSACPPTVLPRQIVGTQPISRAVSSWEFKLNQAAKCSRVFAYTSTTENESTQQLSSPGGGNAGLAFTTIPIGSEATRYPGGHAPRLPPMLYAPVAVTALGFGFNINEGTGYVTTSVKLTPQLLARALTQVYRYDVPDVIPNDPTHPGPTWVHGNPGNITQDPAFQRINSKTVIQPYFASSVPLAPLLTEDHSALNQQVWQWVQSDPATSAWLDSASSAKSNPVLTDPSYVALHLGKAPAPDSYPRAYSGVLNLGQCGPAQGCPEKKDEILNTIDLLPYAPDADTAAATVLAANDSSLQPPFTHLNTAPDGTAGWWGKVGVLPPGQVLMWTVSDMPDMAAYGLIPADLCKASGSACVGPSIASVTKALNSARADSQGLLQINPAKVPTGGYPLVQVIYAAVPTNQDAGSLNDYADLIQYAAGDGQTPGSNPGDLPPGYLPLPASLKAKALAVVRQLRAIAHPTPTPTHSVTSTQSANPTGTGTNSGGTSTSGTTPGSAVGASASTRAGVSGSSSSPSPQGPAVLPPSAQLVGGITRRTDVGEIRWALIAVLIIGGAGALSGIALRSGRMPRWLTRRRT